MKLNEYLSGIPQSATDFALTVGVETSTITRILKGERSPSVHLAVKIERATNGKVTPRDFANSEASGQPA